MTTSFLRHVVRYSPRCLVDGTLEKACVHAPVRRAPFQHGKKFINDLSRCRAFDFGCPHLMRCEHLQFVVKLLLN